MFYSFKRILKLIFFSALIIFILIIAIIEFKLQPALHNVYKSNVTSMLTQIINEAVNRETDTINYNDLITVKTNREGNIVMMQPNLQSVNNISSNVSMRIQEKLSVTKRKRVKIPVLQIFGIEILTQHSPRITAEIIPYGYVKTNLVDIFESAGINQTRHKIHMNIETTVNVLVPLLSDDIKVDTKVPLTEAVIVGQVPEVYIGIEGGLFERAENKE